MLFGLLQEPEEPGMGSVCFGLEEISGEQTFFSVKRSKESCQLDANYRVFTYHQGQKWLKETFYPVVQF